MNTFGRILCATAMIVMLVAAVGCSERTPTDLPQARAELNPNVFLDGEGWNQNIYYQPFFETHYTAVSVDSVWAFNGFEVMLPLRSCVTTDAPICVISWTPL